MTDLLYKLPNTSLCFWWTNPINQLGQLCWKVIISSFHQSFFLSRRGRKEAELLFVTLICLFRCHVNSIFKRHFKVIHILFMVWMYVACLLWKWILSLELTNAMFRLIPGLDTFLITDGQIDTKNGVTLVSRKNFNWVTIAGSELRQPQEGYDLWLMTGELYTEFGAVNTYSAIG